MAPRHRWVESFFFLAALFILFFFSSHQLFYDPGTFWHTVTGDQLRQNGLIRSDPFTYTQQGQAWIPHQWLAEVIMSYAHQRMGLDGLLWLTLLLLSSLFAFLAGRLSMAGCHPLLIALILALTYGAMCYHFHARPHLVSMLFLGFIYALLVDVEAERKTLSSLWLLLPLYALWVNLHGGVLGGMFSFGLVGLGWGVYWLFGWRSPLHCAHDVGMLVIIGLLAAAMVMVNPYGLDMIRMWYEILRQDLPTIISEHRPLDWTEPEGIMVLSMGGLHMLLLLGTWGHKPRVSWLVPLVWFGLAMMRVRNGPLFAVVATIAWADLLPHTRWMRWLARRSDLILIPGIPPPKGTTPWDPQAPTSVLARLVPHVWLLLLPLPWLVPDLLLGRLLIDRNHWPLALLDSLRKECQREGTVLFNEDLYGGFVVYFVPGQKIFIDDRCELHGKNLLMDYVDAFRHQEHVAEWMDKWEKQYGINLALVHSNSTFAKHFLSRNDWHVIATTQAELPEKQVTLFRRDVQNKPQ